MTAIWMRTRSEIRARWRSLAALTLLFGLAAGVVFAAAAGARRTDTAYPRFVDSFAPIDAGGQIGGGFGFPPLDGGRIASFPEVKSSVLIDGFLFVPRTPSGKLAPIGQGGGNAFQSEQAFHDWAQIKLLDGRMFDPTDPHQILVGYGTAGGSSGGLEGAAVHPGDHVVLRFLKKGANQDVFGQAGGASDIPANVLTSPYTVTVAGIVFKPGDVGDNAFGDVFFTPAFDKMYRDRVETQQTMAIRLHRGARDASPFLHRVAGLAANGNVAWGPGSFDSNATGIQRSIRPQATALAVFAALVALSALLVLGQALGRQAFLDSVDNDSYRALGMTRAQFVQNELVKAAILGGLAAVVGIAVAFALSATMPVGLAKVAEPHPGRSADWVVFGIGALVVFATSLAVIAIPAWRGSRAGARTSAESSTRRRPSIVPGKLARWGFSPSAVAGSRLALEPGAGRTAVPVRSTIVGVTISIIAVTAAFGFAAGFDHLFGTPRLYGWGWDVEMGTPYSSADLTSRFAPALRSDPAVAGFSGGYVLAQVEVDGHGRRIPGENVVAIDQLEGDVHPPLLQGRWPRTDGEIALGPKAFRTLDARIGDTVAVRSGSRALSDLRIVGEAELFDFSGSGDLGGGIGLTLHALRTVAPGTPATVFLASFRPGADRTAEVARLRARVGAASVEQSGQNTGNIQDLAPVRRVPVLMAGLLALTAIAAIGNALVTSVRRRRRDLAIMKTIGFVRRQIGTTVAWEASMVSMIALVIGVPVGIAAGRWAWRLYAEQLGVIPEAAVSLLAVALVAVVVLLAANAIALVPGWMAGRIKPAQALRTE